MTHRDLLNRALTRRRVDVLSAEIAVTAPPQASACLVGLHVICQGETPLRHSPLTDPERFLNMLRTHVRDRERSFEMVAERYAYPADFTSPGEQEIREYLLMRLMVNDRAQIESEAKRQPHDDVLLKLNLIALQAHETTDLRFLDGLNYYYEILEGIENVFLFSAYLFLYGRSLDAWIMKTN